MPVLPTHRNQSIDLLTGFYMRATMALNGLTEFGYNYIFLLNEIIFLSLMHVNKNKSQVMVQNPMSTDLLE